MALGRVPVIIADNWVPFSIEHYNYYILIKESDVGKIDGILESKLVSYEILRQNVELIYNTFFSPGIRYTAVLNELVDLSENLPADLDADFLKGRLHSVDFWRANGWLLRQRIWNQSAWKLFQCLRRLKSIILWKS
jgi:hypothetical protein